MQAAAVISHAIEGDGENIKAPTYLVFDTETTGLFNFKLPADDPAQPRLASAAFILCDEAGRELSRQKFYVAPDGWEMGEEAGRVNGLTTEFLASNGVPVAEVLDAYTGHVESGLIVVAFNSQFDTKMMRAELRRAGRPDLFEQTRTICAMRGLHPYGADGLCIMRGFVKLSVACEWFGIVNQNAHDAMADAEAARCLLERMIADGRLPEPKVYYAAGKD